MAIAKARTIGVTGALGVSGLNDLLRQFKTLDKEINKTIRRVNIEIAKEVSNDAIKLGKRQTVGGRPVHRRDRAVRGIKARARQNQASIELQGHKNDAVLSLELGRIFQPVPVNRKNGDKFRYYRQKDLGRLPNSRPGAGIETGVSKVAHSHADSVAIILRSSLLFKSWPDLNAVTLPKRL